MSELLYEIQRGDGTEIGPFDAATIDRMLEAGMVEAGEFFRREGERAWKPLMLFANEKSQPAQPPEPKSVKPPPPPKITPILNKPQPQRTVPPVAPKPPTVRVISDDELDGSSSPRWWIVGVAALVAALGVGWWALKNRDSEPDAEEQDTAVVEPDPAAPAEEAEGDSEPEATIKEAGGVVENPPKTRAGVAFQAKAEAGDAEAQALLADALFYNDPTDAELAEAASWAEKSAAQGHLLGQAIHGCVVLRGEGTPADLEDAISRFREFSSEFNEAADERLDPVWLRWATRFPGSSQEFYQRRYRFLKLAADAGDKQGIVMLAAMTYNWDGAERQGTVGWRVRRLAEDGHPAAMHQMGRFLLDGIGMKPQPAAAEAWFERAAKAGHGRSWFELAKMYHIGKGASGDAAKAKQFLAKALADSNALLGKDVFDSLRGGDDLPADEKLAGAWLASLPDYAKVEALCGAIRDELDPDRGAVDPVAADRWFAELEKIENIHPGSLRDLISAARNLALGSTTASPPVPKNPDESIRWYKRAAHLGSFEAMHSLGSCYSEGYLVGEDKAAARKWYRKAVQTGNPGSIWYYARFLRDQGEHADAAAWFRRGAELEQRYCYDYLADMLAAGQGVPKDDAEATKWYRKFAETGSFTGVAVLCRRLKKKLGSESEPGELAKWQAWLDEQLKSKDKKGQIWDITRAAEEFGSGKPNEDKAEADIWWKKGAALGDRRSMAIASYSAGESGSKEDTAYAIELQRKLAEDGDQFAMARLAFRYDRGDGVKKDQREAMKWYLKAAQKGHEYSLYEVGYRYYRGLGVAKNERAAIQWLKKAADGGSKDAMSVLGQLYAREGKPGANGAEAVKWYGMAALRGDEIAMVNLGGMYMWGIAVPRDYVKGYAWANVAAAKCKYPEAREKAQFNLTNAEKRLSREQVVEAQRLSRTILKRIEDFEKQAWAKYREKEEPEPGTISRSGTAWAVTADGHLLTCAHIVSGAYAIQVRTPDGRRVAARVLKSDVRNDIALLKISDDTLPLTLSQKPEVGQQVATLGFPNTGLQGVEAKLTEGSISALSGIQDDPNSMQVSVPIQPGNSGGPLFDMSGAVVGVISSKLSDAVGLQTTGSLPQAVNYATKISQADPMLAGLRVGRNGSPEKLALPQLVKRVRASVYLVEVSGKAE